MLNGVLDAFFKRGLSGVDINYIYAEGDDYYRGKAEVHALMHILNIALDLGYISLETYAEIKEKLNKGGE